MLRSILLVGVLMACRLHGQLIIEKEVLHEIARSESSGHHGHAKSGTGAPSRGYDMRYHMEVRGIGIINVQAMFGVRAVRTEKRVDLVITLKEWEQVPDVDRVGMDEKHVQILGADVPHMIIPVRPGRDLARLVEVAAFQTKLKQSGYNPAKELNDMLIARMKLQRQP